MLNSTIQIKIKQRLNKLDSQDYDNLKCWHITEAYNKASLGWVRRQIQGVNILQVGDEETTVKIDDLQILLTEIDLELEDKGKYYESQTLPPNYLGFKRLNAEIKKECCENKQDLIAYLVEEVNIPVLLKDELTKPSFEWGETFCTIVNNKIRIYTNGEFNIESCKLLYYRMPRKIQIENCVDISTGLISQEDIITEFKEDIVELILDDAASILAGDIESITQYQINQTRTEKNT